MIPSLSLTLVDTPSDVAAFSAWIEALAEPVAIDTETTGLKWWTPNFTRMVQWGTRDEGYAVPVEWHRRLVTWAMGRVRDKGLPVVMHNSAFDMHALEGDGFPVPDWRNVHDTFVLHHLQAPHLRHGLKGMAIAEYGSWAGHGEVVLKEAFKQYGLTWDTVPVDCPFYWAYGIVDTILTRRLYDDLPRHDAYDQEMAYREVMYRAEVRGMLIDPVYCEELRGRWTCEAQQLALQLEAAGIANPNSNRMVEAVLRDLGWAPGEFTETGQAQLDQLVLAQLQVVPGPLADIAETLVEYKRKTSWTATYLDTFLNNRDSNDRVHASIRTLGARTGRSSIAAPSLQNLPHTPDIRTAVLPYEGDNLWCVDYSGQEYRILAALSGDPAWVHEFEHGAGDPHTMVSGLLDIPREVAKTFNFAMVYGAGTKKLALSTGLTVPQVEHFLKQYAQRFPDVLAFIEDTQREGRRQLRDGEEPHVVTLAGRPVYCDPDQLYALTNYRIQGSGADVLKQAVLRLDAAGLADHIVVPVHDELVLSVPAGWGVDEHVDLMTDDTSYRVVLRAEKEGPFRNWGEKYVIL